MLVFISRRLFGKSQKPVLLYPYGAPNSKKTPANYTEKKKKGNVVGRVTQPTITAYLPIKSKVNGTAVIIFPGGSYFTLGMGHEGSAIAQKFNEIGITAFVVKYRLPHDDIMVDKTTGPLQDAQRAIQIVREKAPEWEIKADKIGIIGFSAGGHLASTLATHLNRIVINNNARINLRPDFVILIYSVISFGSFAHEFSRENLLGKYPSEELLDLYSNEKQVTADTPSCFLVHAVDDDLVPVQNSQLFYEALIKNNVKAQIQILASEGHGFGLNNARGKNKWFTGASEWLRDNGFLPL